MSPGSSAAPSVQAIIVNCVSIVNPELAPIIGDKLEVVMTCPEESHAACPTNSEVITSCKSRPLATSVFIVHSVSPASHVRSATIQVLAAAALTKVEGILHEEASAVSGAMSGLPSATCTSNHPSISSVGAVVPKEHPSIAAALKHLKSHNKPRSTNVPFGCSTSPAVQTIIVNRVPIVEPQFAPIIGHELEVVMAGLEYSHASGPTNSEVITS